MKLFPGGGGRRPNTPEENEAIGNMKLSDAKEEIQYAFERMFHMGRAIGLATQEYYNRIPGSKHEMFIDGSIIIQIAQLILQANQQPRIADNELALVKYYMEKYTREQVKNEDREWRKKMR